MRLGCDQGLRRRGKTRPKAPSPTPRLSASSTYWRGPILSLHQTVRLWRGSALKRVVGQGLRLVTACSRRCALRGELGLSAATARKLGMKPNSARRVTIASGRAEVGPSPRQLVLKVSPQVARALRGARKVTVLLEVSAGSQSTEERRASRRLTLR